MAYRDKENRPSDGQEPKRSWTRDPQGIADFAQRLRAALAQHGDSQGSLAARLAVHPNLVSKLCAGTFRVLSLDVVQGLWRWCLANGISPAWLFIGMDESETASVAEAAARMAAPQIVERVLREIFGDNLPADNLARMSGKARLLPASNFMPARRAAEPPRPARRGYRTVPAADVPTHGQWAEEYVPIVGRISAGQTSLLAEPSRYPPAFATDYLVYHGAPKGAVAVRVAGDSMTPVYCDGDMVVVDTSKQVQDGVCCVILEWEGQHDVRLKKLILRGRKAFLTSLNPAHPPVEVPATSILAAYAMVDHLPFLVP